MTDAKGTATFWADVRASIEEKSADTRQTVKEHYVDKEIASRVEKTIAAIDSLSKLEADLRKIRPDQEQFDGAGKVVNAFYSKAKAEERKKVVEKIERVEAALTDVFETQDFEKLKKLNTEKADAAA